MTDPTSLDGADFSKLYEQEFTVTERTDKPWQLAKEYYERCDRYDETVCTGRREGEAVPATDEEFRLINRHAIKVLRELQDLARAFGFSANDLRDAMHEYIRTQLKCPHGFTLCWYCHYHELQEILRRRR